MRTIRALLIFWVSGVPLISLSQEVIVDSADAKRPTDASVTSAPDDSENTHHPPPTDSPAETPPDRMPSLQRKIDGAIAALSDEPSLEALEIAALERADLLRKETKRWKYTAKLQALLPELKLDADFDMGRDESLDRYQEKPDRWGADTDRGYTLGATAHWRLGELIFNTDELKVYDLLSERASRREALLSTLVGYYFERRRLQLTMMLAPPDDLQALLELRIRISELTAAIDSLTGGRLTHRISQGKRHLK